MTETRLPGDFAVCQISGVGGLGISVAELAIRGQYREWDHALAYLGQGMCLQAEPHGAQIVARPVRPGDLWSSGLPSLALTDTQQGLAWMTGQSLDGTPYSWLDYAALAAAGLHIPAPHLRAYIKASAHAMCSQLVDLFRLLLGSHLFTGETPERWEGDVTPWDLGHLLTQAGARPAP
jgi:hypothetical protein